MRYVFLSFALIIHGLVVLTTGETCFSPIILKGRKPSFSPFHSFHLFTLKGR
ncbi:hypothetical protein HMPREF1991_03099 [Hoylesella loescheii DSM 19665 = JCM 12249 = ATCC 15930]|uniref:Uncharacterized protein n=1 Tax=Hoylesella loescheii DSM 19665 = JCM 12249 = ATCC 15930 TaxID=1122985 RepID=A0A069QD90_HOYLO|nr:hypothetical protein HMPREF1991_03099 [Hoylesella loescheii DSM 19665 = JCM 12249 = ATCC 15930]